MDGLDELFSKVSKAFAVRWFSEKARKEELFLFAYVMECFLEGYLYVTLDTNGKIFPDPSFLFLKKDPTVFDKEKFQKFCEDLCKEFLNLSPEFFEQEEKIHTTPTKPFVFKQNRLYLQRSWLLEKECSELILQKNKKETLKQFCSEDILQRLERDPAYQKLDSIQTEAIVQALTHPISIIAGGPGSGKTFTIVHLVKFFLEVWPLKRKPKILVMAPTGKASQRLEEFFQSFLASDLFSLIEIKTVHAHLKISKRFDLFSSNICLDADLVVMDEASMLDCILIHSLLKAVPDTCRLIFVGDPDQLSPVELGSFFSELCQEQKKLLVLRLESVHRFSSSWKNLFEHIRKKEVEKTLTVLMKSEKEKIFFHEITTWDGPKIHNLLFDALLSLYDIERVSEETFFEKSKKFRILSPLRKGLWGVDMINRLSCDICQKYFGQKFFLPVLMTHNDYQLQIFNGTAGIATYDKGKISKPYFLRKRFLHLPFNCLEIAYAISVHKSQGSEYQDLMLILPPGSELFGREMLYTALSRAQKKITIITSKEILRKIMEKTSKKFLEFF